MPLIMGYCIKWVIEGFNILQCGFKTKHLFFFLLHLTDKSKSGKAYFSTKKCKKIFCFKKKCIFAVLYKHLDMMLLEKYLFDK